MYILTKILGILTIKQIGEIFITCIYANSPGFFEAFGDKVNPEILAYALYKSPGFKSTVEEFKNYLTETINYFSLKGVNISEEEIIEYIASIESYYTKFIPASDLYYKFHIRREEIHQKNEFVKKNYSNFQNHIKNLRILYSSNFVIHTDYFGIPDDNFKEVNKLFEELKKIYGYYTIKKMDIYDIITRYVWLSYEKCGKMLYL